jgi:hypothetical protein
MTRPEKYLRGIWDIEKPAPPVDTDAREVAVSLADSGPRYVSADLEFAVWAATVGEVGDAAYVTLTGPLGHVSAGHELLCTGAFSQHPRYGWQFAVETFRSALPQTADGVMRWLITRVPGIGPAFARAIVNHFGVDEVFSELDRQPERLREVRTPSGRPISAKAVERAIAAWREVATVREVEAFLFAHGIGAGLAGRLVRQYGDGVVAVLSQEPYRLIELPRVGFKIADGIARSLGIELDHPQRLQAVCASFSRRRNPTATRLCRLPSCGRGRGGCSASESSIRSRVRRPWRRSRENALFDRLGCWSVVAVRVGRIVA